MSDAGWFGDPSGRFAHRWWDGTTWSEHVVSAAGAVVADALPASGQPYPPPAAGAASAAGAADDATTMKRPAGLDGALAGSGPQASAPAADHAQQPGRTSQQPQWQPQGAAPGSEAPYPSAAYAPAPYTPAYAPAYGPASGPRNRYAPGAGLAIGALGVVLVALSLLVLKWVDTDKGSFLDISSAARDVGRRSAPDVITYGYVAWLGFVLLGLTAILVVVSGVPLPRTDNSYGRIACAFFAGLGLVLHAWTYRALFTSDSSPEIGAWLAAPGYLFVLVATVLGARRAAPAYPPTYPPDGYPPAH